MKIGLLSDTHSFLDSKIWKYFKDCDEIWHAGDVGSLKVIDEIRSKKKFRGVYGNIDDNRLRQELPLNQIFEVEDVKVVITHIGGYPGAYKPRVAELLKQEKPQLYICGHSHICKASRDQQLDLLHLNPGACGNHGFHPVKTIMTFEIKSGNISELKVVELGRRGH